MTIEASNIKEYLAAVPDHQRTAVTKLLEVIRKNIPSEFEERIIYKMLGFVVPFSLFPAGYHCDTSLPLPFINVAAQKNFIALYHMGIYASPELLSWFTETYNKLGLKKLDMGKSCIRFKKPDDIPFELIAKLVKKMTAEDWIKLYKGAFNK